MLDVYTLIHLVMLAGWAILFYRAGNIENSPGVIWAAISVMAYGVTWLYFSRGLIACAIVQILLFVGLGVVKGLHKEFPWGTKKKKRRRRRL